MSRGHPDLDTPLGRTWLAAASMEHSIEHGGIECDPALREHIGRLAHGQKVLAEYIELILNTGVFHAQR